jgi:hypothetical protein
MKHSFWFSILLFIFMPTQSRAQTADAIQALSQQGNHREAADLGKAALKKPAATGELLDATLQSLRQLGAADQEQGEVIEAAVLVHAKKPEMLLAAGKAYLSLQHTGTLVDGVFVRGRTSDYNNRKSTELKDRVRSAQLIEAAWKSLPEEADKALRQSVLLALAEALNFHEDDFASAWSLLHLTDLTTLADFDDESGLDEPARGYPVDTEGKPIFFRAAESWESAKNDGERLLWIFQTQTKLGPEQDREARAALALLAKTWFSVQTLADYGFRFDASEDEGATKNGIATLNTLKDDETVAKLATGPKRFTLPEGADFLRLFQALADDTKAPTAMRLEAWQEISDELKDRRQYARAADALSKAIDLQTDLDQKKSLQAQLNQITGNWGRFEPQGALPAGSEAKLQLVFRNAKKIGLTARKVDVTKLLADTEAYLRSEPQDQDWQRLNISAIGQRLLDKDGAKYLSQEPVVWTQELEPRANHWDKRVEVPTPLKEAGAYLVEGSFEGGSKTRVLLWLEGLVLVKTAQAKAAHYFLADAVTGAPVVGAKMKFFGYKQDWGKSGLLNPQKRIYQFKDFQATSDEHGVLNAKVFNLDEYQWLIQASTADGRLAFLGFENLHFNSSNERSSEQTRLYSITDRPVYRPNQEVKWKAWARAVSYDPKLNTNKFKGSTIEVTISDPKGEELLKKTYKADDSGAIHDVLMLGDEATLGEYGISFVRKRAIREEDHLGHHTFRVEEYKKPEFEVKVEAPDKPVALGDSFEVKVKADYYFGGPVKQGKVKYKVQRSTHTDRWFPMGRWDWLFGSGYSWRASYYDWYPGAQNWCSCIPRYPWIRWHSDPPELVAEGEAALKEDGTFSVKIDTTLAKELQGNEDHRYEIEAEVTDASRRTIFGKGSVLAARRAFEVYVSLDRGYYNAGDNGEVSVNARTLDGREVKAAGELTLHRITYAKDGTPSEEAVRTLAISLREMSNNASITRITFPKGGQYRISAKLKDDAEHEIEGTTFFTVRGEGFEKGKDFRFDDLELITQKD